MSTKMLKFSEPSQVLEALQLARRSPTVPEIPARLMQTMLELELAGLVVYVPEYVGHLTSRSRSVVRITPAGRKRVMAAYRASQEVVSAPVMSVG